MEPRAVPRKKQRCLGSSSSRLGTSSHARCLAAQACRACCAEEWSSSRWVGSFVFRGPAAYPCCRWCCREPALHCTLRVVKGQQPSIEAAAGAAPGFHVACCACTVHLARLHPHLHDFVKRCDSIRSLYLMVSPHCLVVAVLCGFFRTLPGEWQQEPRQLAVEPSVLSLHR